jgi:peptidoglycan/xylan/chitin deacetylase (PgdA/CDA1 family)
MHHAAFMRNRAAVLTYHAIGSVPRDAPLYNAFIPTAMFEAQMAFLAQRRRVVALSDLSAVRGRGARSVAITFDDAYRSVLTLAAPVLARYGFPATVFVPTKWIGHRNAWDPASDLPLEIMTREELLELAGMGFEIASHGHAHIDLGKADSASAREDVEESARRLEELLGHRPRRLAYPYGSSSETARDAVRAAGFDAAYALEAAAGPMALERIPIFPADRRWLFAFKTSGRYGAWRRTPLVSKPYAWLRPLVRGRFWP